MKRQLAGRHNFKLATEAIDPAHAGRSTWFKRMTMIWLTGMLILLPLDFIKLPLNMTLVDGWVLMGLPGLWLSLVRGRYVINLSYIIAMWLILVASVASTFAAPAPRSSLIVLLKEVYVFVWFVTLVAILVRLSASDFRRTLVVWSGMVLINGLVIVAQFLSPEFWRFTAGLAGNLKDYDIYRPSGLFLNANLAAFFQLLGFVPLMLASPSKKVAMILGVLLLPTMLLTGSMGATLAFIAGLMVTIVAVVWSGHLLLTLKILGRVALVLLLLGGVLYFIISHNERYHRHFEQIFLGRSERSSEGRFNLWQRGLEAYVDNEVMLWGVGPENFREVDLARTDNQLHNDFLAFSVERGLLGTLGLVLFAGLALSRAAYIVLLYNKYPGQASLTVVVFLGAMTAAIVESLTHQVFHFRALWIVLAFQEAVLFRMMTVNRAVEPAPEFLSGSPDYGRRLVVRTDVRGG
ncbi:MAG TPA: O-antigen ligase family protein [Anaerolineae bacterium]|nr:O-antigen ligase family protein [Anaerolineae bacterium]